MNDEGNTKRESQQSQASSASPLPSSDTQRGLNSNEPHRHNVHNPSTQNPQKPDKWFRNPDWHMVWLTVSLFVVGIVTACIFYRQLAQMKTQTGILNTQAKQAAADSGKSLEEMQKQTRLDRVSLQLKLGGTRIQVLMGLYQLRPPVRVSVSFKGLGKLPKNNLTFRTAVEFRDNDKIPPRDEDFLGPPEKPNFPKGCIGKGPPKHIQDLSLIHI